MPQIRINKDPQTGAQVAFGEIGSSIIGREAEVGLIKVVIITCGLYQGQ